MLKHAVATVVAMAFLIGCGAQKGSTMVSVGKGDQPGPLQTVKSGYEGKYAVYANTSLTPVRVDVLEEGDKYGFSKAADGKLSAVLGDMQVPLESTMSTGYYIKYQK